MGHSAAKSLAQLLRLDILLAIFAALFLPLLYLSRDLAYALKCSMPPTTICACGFILNSLYDIERDRENHPDRPLPQGTLSTTFAATLYFILLACALMLVREYANASNIFLYIVLVLSTVNYNVIISFLPAFKNLCVGLLVVTTTLLLRNFEMTGRPTIYVVGAMFFYFIGKEMLNDIIDAKGDGNTLVKQIGITRAQYPAFGMKFLADTFLLMGSTNPLSVTLALSLAGSDIVCVYLWRTENLRHWVASIMRLQSVVGIYYLF